MPCLKVTRKKPVMPSWIKITLISVLLAACESSDPPGGRPINSGSTTTGSTPLNGTTPYVRTGVNGSLKGEVWSAETGTRLNLDTGELKYLSTGMIYPRADGREYAELFIDFQHCSDGGCGDFPGKSDAVFLRDTATGEVGDLLEVFAKLAGPVLISPDGERLVLLATEEDVCKDQLDYFVTLLSRDGDVLGIGSQDVVGYDWMPDSQLAYMVLDDDSYILVIESEPNTFVGFIAAELPDLGGFASRFRISPDGKQVLIEVVTNASISISSLEF